MTPEEYEKVLEEIKVTSGKNASDYLKVLNPLEAISILQDESKFERYRPPHSEARVCACGNTYYLGTPYEKCNPVCRDLCDDCIDKLSDATMGIPYAKRENPLWAESD
jgi:hypothetical protein